MSLVKYCEHCDGPLSDGELVHTGAECAMFLAKRISHELVNDSRVSTDEDIFAQLASAIMLLAQVSTDSSKAEVPTYEKTINLGKK